MAYSFKVKTLAIMNNLKNHQDGEICYCEETKKAYKWLNGKWEDVKITTGEGGEMKMNLYDLNQSAINQFPPIELEQLKEKVSNLFINLINESKNNHFMLLSNEYKYYTIFEYKENTEDAVSAISSILNELGDVLSIDVTEDNSAIELWIRPEGEDNCIVFYFFPYDSGVVYFG